jgi:hypothetical protein
VEGRGRGSGESLPMKKSRNVYLSQVAMMSDYKMTL